MMRKKHAFVTGITGQDGGYLAELLLSKEYRVTGLVRTTGARSVNSAVTLELWNMRDTDQLTQLLTQNKPDEFYNFAAFSTGTGMFDDPVTMGEINGLAITHILEAIRAGNPGTRFCQASSSEIFGTASGSPQTEMSQPDPRSPYGAAKLYAQQIIKIYRQRFGSFACSAILYNHESPRRADKFVSRKVARAAAMISKGLADYVLLGDLSARRDWGYAGDYVNAMWLMLQQDKPGDYVIATGVTHSVEDLCCIAFDHVGLDYKKHVRVTTQPNRAPEPLQLVGVPDKAAHELGWTRTVTFEQIITQMVDSDLLELNSLKGSSK